MQRGFLFVLRFFCEKVYVVLALGLLYIDASANDDLPPGAFAPGDLFFQYSSMEDSKWHR